jgi:hypothetical protein
MSFSKKAFPAQTGGSAGVEVENYYLGAVLGGATKPRLRLLA